MPAPEIAALFEYATLSGGERSWLALAPTVRAAGYQLRALAPPTGPLADALGQADIEITPWTTAETDARPTLASQRQRLADTLTRRRPTLLHANSLAMGRLSGPVARELRLPSLTHLRDIIGLAPANIGDLNCHRRLLAVSHAVRDHHLAQGLAAEKTFVMYNGIDLDHFRPQPPTGWLHAELGLDPATPLVGAIGQIALRKGLDVFADVIAAVAVQHPQVAFLHVGARFSRKAESLELESRLQSLAAGPLAGRFFLLGERTDVPRLLPELTLLLHTARQEPLGRVLLEAAAAGVPVVATNVGGTQEIFPAPPPSALLTPRDATPALAAAVLRLLDSPTVRQELATHARHHAQKTFTTPLAAQNLLHHYQSLP